MAQQTLCRGPAGIHRITREGVAPGYRWRCVDCNGQFKIAPSAYNLDLARERQLNQTTKAR